MSGETAIFLDQDFGAGGPAQAAVPLKRDAAELQLWTSPCDEPLAVDAGAPRGQVVAATDASGSQTIWYAVSGDQLIVSRSQRAVVLALGGFQLSSQAVLWMLSSGTLGPGGAWDARIRPLPPDSQLLFDAAAGRVSVSSRPIVFEYNEQPDDAHRRQLAAAIGRAFANLDLSNGNWVLPLSGGVDSRAILLWLRNRGPIPCITWATQRSLSTSGSDAQVAGQVVRHFGLEHRFLDCEPSDEPFEILMDRFLEAGEGRIDHISGYLDGFRMWAELRDSGVTGVIRGDEGFGWVPVATELEARQSVGLAMWDDFSGMRVLRGALEARHGRQNFPGALQFDRDPSLAAWRDRLYHAFRMPSVLAALNDLKTPFVNIAAPFLSRDILTTVRRMPDHLRTGKRLFRQLVDEAGPPIGYASRSSTPAVHGILATRNARETIANELSSNHAQRILGAEVCVAIVGEFAPRGDSAPRTTAVGVIKRLLPRTLKQKVKRWVPARRLPAETVALRAYLVSRMTRLLESDGRAANPRNTDTMVEGAAG